MGINIYVKYKTLLIAILLKIEKLLNNCSILLTIVNYIIQLMSLNNKLNLS